MNTTCKNCGSLSMQAFCGNCGQKMHIHRFDTKHIFFHEIPHGVVHLDKGFLLTTKALLTRPGHFIREYIEGKRVNHYGPIQYLFIIGIVMGIMMSAFKFSEIAVKVNTDIQKVSPKVEEVNTIKSNQDKAKEKQKKEKLDAFTKKIPSIISNQYKWFIFITIPASALAGFWITRKLGYNFAENIVRALYTSSLSGIFNILTAPIMLFPSLYMVHSITSSILSIIIPTIVWNQFLKIQVADGKIRAAKIFLYWILQFILFIITLIIFGTIAVLITMKELKSQ
jgi:hypothetical protein